METKPLEINSIRIPISIDPCPISEAVVEIRFDSSFGSEAIFASIYNELKKDYKEVKKLPILQLPSSLIEQTSSFQFKPHYELISENYLARIGPRVFSIHAVNKYKGWNDYKEHIFKGFDSLRKIDVVNHVSRFGLRYINDFPNTDIFKKIQLKVGSDSLPMTLRNTSIRTEVPINSYGNTLMINNQNTSSVIDIDTWLEFKKSENFFSNMKRYVNNGHESKKIVFFNLLKPDYLLKFNPKY